jgi:hypothetical protein
MIRVFIEGIGVVGPGLEGWSRARAVLRGEEPYEFKPVLLRPVTLLPPAERRRAGATVKLALGTGVEALAHSGRDPADMTMVFAASGGDGETIHETLSVLATQQREVSPTRFHNSVHNAPSGYWAVATGSRVPSTSLSAFDRSFAAGLLEAAVQASVQNCPVTLIAYDVPYPSPLHSARPISTMFSVAVVLTPEATERSISALMVGMATEESPETAMPETAMPETTMPETTMPETTIADIALEEVRRGNPAARVLPLLAAIAREHSGTIHLDGLEVVVSPP